MTDEIALRLAHQASDDIASLAVAMPEISTLSRFHSLGEDRPRPLGGLHLRTTEHENLNNLPSICLDDPDSFSDGDAGIVVPMSEPTVLDFHSRKRIT